MSRETEKVFREFHRYTEGKKFESDEAFNEEFRKFIERCNEGEIAFDQTPEEEALELMDLAYEAETEREALKYAKQALKKDANCLDARLLILETYPQEKRRKELEKVIRQEEKRLREEDFFSEDCIGEFYMILETRPYMRARFAYAMLLQDMGKKRLAAGEYQEIIRLNENDNLGCRYSLMCLYALLEDVEKARALNKKYDDEESLHMLLPQAMLYYKVDDLKTARAFLKKAHRQNPYLLDFVKDGLEGFEDLIDEEMSLGGYQQGSISEVVTVAVELRALVQETIGFFEWAAKELERTKKK